MPGSLPPRSLRPPTRRSQNASPIGGARRRNPSRSARRTSMPAAKPLPPGSMIGILGGGQLGRMLALAAARLGFRCHVFSPDAFSPAFDVAARSTIADYSDANALSTFAGSVNVVTYEFEN